MKNTAYPRKATEAQIDANRRNAQKSTGPRSAQGKGASSRNGLKHGLSGDKHILPGENPEEFLLLLKDLYDNFSPVGLGEEKLVQRIAADQWRLDRTLPMEAAIYRQRLQAVAAGDYTRKRELVNHKQNHERNPEIPPAPAPPDPGDRLTRAFIVDGDGRNSLTRLARYETSIERSIDRCLRQLKAFQAARSAPRPTPNPSPKPPIPRKQAHKPPRNCPRRPQKLKITKRTQKMGVVRHARTTAPVQTPLARPKSRGKTVRRHPRRPPAGRTNAEKTTNRSYPRAPRTAPSPAHCFICVHLCPSVVHCLIVPRAGTGCCFPNGCAGADPPPIPGGRQTTHGRSCRRPRAACSPR